MLWTEEKIAKLSDADLKQVHENATKKQDRTTIELCAAELAKRPAVAKRRVSSKSDGLRLLEDEVSTKLGDLAKTLKSRFDLSPERAKVLARAGEKHVGHNLTDRAGKAKTGGLLMKGLVALDRYLSYRTGERRVYICAWLQKNTATENLVYQVYGSRDLFHDATPLEELRPGLDLASVRIDGLVGHSFSDFDEAAECFAVAIEKLAG